MRRLAPRIFFCAALLAAPAATGHKDDEAEVLLQAAIHKEVADGDLEAAIQLYRKIVAAHRESRAVAARALVRMGQCYEKLGRSEAQRAYEQVVRDYADQPEALRLARARLAALNRSAVRRSGMAVRRVWSDRMVSLDGAPSPDGRYVSFVDWDTGDLAVRDLAAGTNRRLTNKGSWEQSRDFALFSRWSPDGRQLVYDWSIASTAPPGSDGAMELRVISFKGGQARTLTRFPPGEWIQCYDWSPDGSQILVFHELRDGNRRIALVSVADGTIKELRRFDRAVRWPVNMSFSRDGRYIVYDNPQGANNADFDIFLLPAGGGQETPLVRHPAHDFVLGWTPDGRGVLFASDRTGNLGFWLARVREGKPEGPPRLVRADVGRAVPLGFTRAGSFIYGHLTEMQDVYFAQLDLDTGKVVVPPAKAIRTFEGLNLWPEFSPDGTRLAYVSERGRFASNLSRSARLCVRTLKTGDEREFPNEFRRMAGPRWSPDGRAIFVAAWDPQHLGIYRVDLETGEFRPVVMTEPNDVSDHHVSGDGKALFYAAADRSANTSRILVRDLASGSDSELFRGGAADRFALDVSPDGRWIAFINRQADKLLRVIPMAGGEPRTVWRFSLSREGYTPLCWTASGTHILVGAGTPGSSDRKADLWQVNVQTGDARKLEIGMFGLEGLSAHRDGTQVAFSSLGAVERFNEVWAIDNFLPDDEPRPVETATGSPAGKLTAGVSMPKIPPEIGDAFSPERTRRRPGAAEARNDAFSDSFEGETTAAFWELHQQAGSVSLSPEYRRSGAQSVKFASRFAGANVSKEMWLVYKFPALTRGNISVWVFDTSQGRETLYLGFELRNSVLSEGMQGFRRGVGAMDYDPLHYHYYYEGDGVQCMASRRSTGWHKLEVRVNPAQTLFVVDGTVCGAMAGDYPFDGIGIYVRGPYWRPDAVFYFDDFQFTPYQRSSRDRD